MQLLITDINERGLGIGRHEGLAVFVPDCLPGDEIEAEITLQRKAYAYARCTRLLCPSPDRVAPFCPVFGVCGGCTLQSLDYDAQLALKRRHIVEALSRIGHIDNAEALVAPVIGMPSPLRVRNKTAFPFGGAPGTPQIGLYARGSHELVDVKDCPLQHEAADAVLKTVRRFLRKYPLTVYDERSGQGLLRHLLIRVGFRSGEVMVVLVINGRTLPHELRLISALERCLDGLFTDDGVAMRLQSVYLNHHSRDSNVITGAESTLLYGEPYILERLLGQDFRISPLSFFQVNTEQTERLYSLVRQLVRPAGDGLVLDLYCGTGSIALTLAAHGGRVLGCDVVDSAIADARENAIAAGLTDRASFVVAPAESFLPDYLANGGRANAAVLDPPRSGCKPALLQALRDSAIPRVVYVSCNPATLARDLQMLRGAYELRSVTPVDMFPHTMHVETVVLLSRKTPNDVIHVDLELDELDITAAEAF